MQAAGPDALESWQKREKKQRKKKQRETRREKKRKKKRQNEGIALPAA